MLLKSSNKRKSVLVVRASYNKIIQKKKQFIRIAFFLNIIINTFYSSFNGGSTLESY